jgi:hypothetical protein
MLRPDPPIVPLRDCHDQRWQDDAEAISPAWEISLPLLRARENPGAQHCPDPFPFASELLHFLSRAFGSSSVWQDLASMNVADCSELPTTTACPEPLSALTRT